MVRVKEIKDQRTSMFKMVYILFLFATDIITDIMAQTVPVVSPSPTATVRENADTTLTCRYSPSGGCPSSILFEWYKNDIRALILAWNSPDCIYGAGDSSLPFSCSVDPIGGCVVTLTLVQVQNNQNGDQWQCLIASKFSSKTDIYVQVPITSVQLKSPNSNQVSLVENVPYRFECETSAARPPATIKWFKQHNGGSAEITSVVTPGTWSNGTLTVTTSTLDYTSSRSDDGFEIHCQATHVASPTFTSSRKPELTILYAPSVAVLQDQRVIVSTSFTLTCSVTEGVPSETTVGWTRSEDGWSQTGRTLSLNPLTRADAADYTCTSSNTMVPTGGTGIAGSDAKTFSLVVLYAPVINTLPDIDIVESNQLSVHCSTTSGLPVQTSHRWTRSTGGSWSQEGQTLAISSVLKGDAADFTCTAWNTMDPTDGAAVRGEDRETFTLNILYPPTINAIPDMAIAVDSPLTVTCTTIPGNPLKTTFIWTKNTSSTWSHTGATLSIISVQKADADVYTCTATNVMIPTEGSQQNGEDTESFALDVLYRTSITRFTIVEETGTSPYTVDENSTGTFRCSVESNPGSNLVISGPRGVLVQQSGTRDVAYAVSIGCMGAGTYECRGYNHLNEADRPTKNLELRVRCHPRPSGSVEPIITVFKALYDSVTLTVSFIAYPPPTFRWFKQRSNDSENEYDLIASETLNTFTIEDLIPADFRRYKVEVANNIAPNYEQIYSLEVQEPSDAAATSSGSAAVIGGGVGATVAVIVAVVVVVTVMVRRRRAAQKDTNNQMDTNKRKESDTPVNDDNQYYNLHSNSASTGNNEGAGSQAYEDLRATTKNSQLYDQLQQTQGDITYTSINDDNRSTYEKLDPKLKQNDGVYDDVDKKQDTHRQSQDDRQAHSNMN